MSSQLFISEDGVIRKKRGLSKVAINLNTVLDLSLESLKAKNNQVYIDLRNQEDNIDEGIIYANLSNIAQGYTIIYKTRCKKIIQQPVEGISSKINLVGNYNYWIPPLTHCLMMLEDRTVKVYIDKYDFNIFEINTNVFRESAYIINKFYHPICLGESLVGLSLTTKTFLREAKDIVNRILSSSPNHDLGLANGYKFNSSTNKYVHLIYQTITLQHKNINTPEEAIEWWNEFNFQELLNEILRWG